MNHQEAVNTFASDRPLFEAKGVIIPDATMYIPDEWKSDYRLAMDAQPQLSTTPNAGIPTLFTTMIDPQVYEILFSPNKAVEIFGEVKKGDWTTQTAMFPTVEHAGEVTSYGDFATSGRTTANANWPQRQSYLYQTIMEYGELELARAGEARINWASELQRSGATLFAKYQNFSYFYGISGLQCFGAFNDPNLSGPLTPAPKAAGGNKWVTNGVITATPNEIYNDIQSLLLQLISQSGSLVNAESKLVLALSPQSKFALTATNSFNVNVASLLKDNIPNLRIIDAVQYGALSASNPQGVAAGNFVQLIAESIEGQQSAYCAFNEKMRSHPMIRDLSSFRQKMTGGTWGTIIRMPMAISSMLGV